MNTDLWPPFARRSPAALEGAKRGKRLIGGIGQSAEFEGAVVDRLRRQTLVLSPAEVYMEKIDAASEKFYGNIRMDLLRQAARVTVDFRAMRLALR